MQPPSGAPVTVATLNTLGLHIVKSRLPTRYRLIAAAFEAGDADVVCVQEIATYWHLRLLARRMPSFAHVGCRRGRLGPAGALVTFSRLPVAGTEYHRIGPSPGAPDIARLPLRNRVTAGLRGALVTRLAGSGLAVVNTHTTSNKDGDWSLDNRHYGVHHAQLAALAAVMRGVGDPAVLCGDFNTPRDSALFARFLAESGLSDAFGGTCPPTYRAEYLPAGAVAYCVDFILTSPGVRTGSRGLLFTDRHPALPAPGYLSDHVGLTATLSPGSDICLGASGGQDFSRMAQTRLASRPGARRGRRSQPQSRLTSPTIPRPRPDSSFLAGWRCRGTPSARGRLSHTSTRSRTPSDSRRTQSNGSPPRPSVHGMPSAAVAACTTLATSSLMTSSQSSARHARPQWATIVRVNARASRAAVGSALTGPRPVNNGHSTETTPSPAIRVFRSN